MRIRVLAHSRVYFFTYVVDLDHARLLEDDELAEDAELGVNELQARNGRVGRQRLGGHHQLQLAKLLKCGPVFRERGETTRTNKSVTRGRSTTANNRKVR